MSLAENHWFFKRVLGSSTTQQRALSGLAHTFPSSHTTLISSCVHHLHACCLPSPTPASALTSSLSLVGWQMGFILAVWDSAKQITCYLLFRLPTKGLACSSSSPCTTDQVKAHRCLLQAPEADLRKYSTRSGVREDWAVSWLKHLLAVWQWASYSTCLGSATGKIGNYSCYRTHCAYKWG